MSRSNLDTPKQQRTVLLATDQQNSVLSEIVSGRNNPMAYSAYGHQSAEHEVVSGLGFNGELREASRWYFLGNGYRVYNPRLMRFHSPDSWSPFGRGGLNAYMYCVGDPVNSSDPTGHMHKSFLSIFKKSKAVSKAPSTSSVAQLVPPETPVTTRARTQSMASATEAAPSDQALRHLSAEEWMATRSAEPVTPLRDPSTGDPIFDILPFESRPRPRPPQPAVPESLMSYDEFSNHHYASGFQSNGSERRLSNGMTVVTDNRGMERIILPSLPRVVIGQGGEQRVILGNANQQIRK